VEKTVEAGRNGEGGTSTALGSDRAEAGASSREWTLTESDGGAVFEKPYGRRSARSSRAAAKGVSDSGRCWHAAGNADFGSRSAHAGHDALLSSKYAWIEWGRLRERPHDPEPRAVKRFIQLDWILDRGWQDNARRHARGLVSRAHRADP
jgi:hypothetical protein